MSGYSMMWLDYSNEYIKGDGFESYRDFVLSRMRAVFIDSSVKGSVVESELSLFFSSFFGFEPDFGVAADKACLFVGLFDCDELALRLSSEDMASVGDEGFIIKDCSDCVLLAARDMRGLIYGCFWFISLLQRCIDIDSICIIKNPDRALRLVNHWDNMDGSIERGYAGMSIFFADNGFRDDFDRIRDYARFLASVGINGVVINNVNVKDEALFLITERYLSELAALADIFRDYGIGLYISVNFMSPVYVGSMSSADPLDSEVVKWWGAVIASIYSAIPDFGGFMVKADSEFNPGPHSYGRSQSDGANMFARLLKPYGGVVIWRAFVYQLQDWRDISVDRARAAYDIFYPLDGSFDDNVVLQIKNGPMDFQVREPVSPLFGRLKRTNQMLELQITQEYTGQQIDVCYLAPMWKEVLSFVPDPEGEAVTVSSIVSYKNSAVAGMSGVVNVGDDYNWTGHWLAQANLFAYGRLSFSSDLSAEDIAEEWVRLSISSDEDCVSDIKDILMSSWSVYEMYTTPFGLGWMVTPGNHYGPSPEGYEYSIWGTYHRANNVEIGVDRTDIGTGFVSQYHDYWKNVYSDRSKCPEDLILFFHRLPYSYVMKNGKTLIQNYYDLHFKGYASVCDMYERWKSLKGCIEQGVFYDVCERFERQKKNALEWRDVINSFFYRKSGICDNKGRSLY